MLRACVAPGPRAATCREGAHHALFQAPAACRFPPAALVVLAPRCWRSTPRPTGRGRRRLAAAEGRRVARLRPGCRPVAFTGATDTRGEEASPRHRARGDPHVRHDRPVRRHGYSPVSRRHPGRGVGGPTASHRRRADTLQGARHRSLPGCPAGDDPGARALLAERLRVAALSGEAERAPAVQDRDRRARHPLHPRQVAPRECASAGHDPRLARLGDRAARDRRPAHRPHRPRRRRRGRVRPGAPVCSRLRLLGRADRARLVGRAEPRRPGGS